MFAFIFAAILPLLAPTAHAQGADLEQSCEDMALTIDIQEHKVDVAHQDMMTCYFDKRCNPTPQMDVYEERWLTLYDELTSLEHIYEVVCEANFEQPKKAPRR